MLDIDKKQTYFWQPKAWTLGILCFLVLGLVPFKGCGDGTKPVVLPLHYQPTDSSFTSATGWDVSLTKASLSFQAIRFLEGEAGYAELIPKALEPFRKLFSKEAMAHPGHYLEEGVKAELIYQKKLNLLGKELSHVGDMRGFTGLYDSAELEFAASDSLQLEGKASKDGKEITFATQISLGKRSIKGIRFVREVTVEGGKVHMELPLKVFFQWIDFSKFTQGKEAYSPDTASQNILRKAALNNANYKISWK